VSRPASLALAACVLASACTLEPGDGFATVEAGELELALVASDQPLTTDRGYRVELRELGVRVEHLLLLERTGPSAGDEAVEPSLCHGDHCHTEDGDSVEHEDSAEPDDAYRPLVEAHVDRALDLLAGDHVALTDFEPSAELPEGSIDRLELELADLRVRARVEGGELTEPAELELDLPLSAPITKDLSLAIDRDGPRALAPYVVVHLDGSLLDRFELASLARDGVITIDEASEGSEHVMHWLAGAEVEVHFDGSGGETHADHGHHEP